MIPPFHPYTEKSVGQRVKVAKNPVDESKGFEEGTVELVHKWQGIKVHWDNPKFYFLVTDHAYVLPV